MKRCKYRILAIVMIICMLATTVVYADSYETETVIIDGVTYTVVMQETANCNTVSMYDNNNVLTDKYCYMKDEHKLVNVLTGEIIYAEESDSTQTKNRSADADGYYYYGTYSYPFGQINGVATLVSGLLAIGIPFGIATEIAATVKVVGLISAPTGALGVVIEVVIDEFGKVDSQYQYCKRIVNTYDKISENDYHIDGPREWIRKTSIDA